MSALETIQGLLVPGSVPPLHSNQVHLKAAASASTAPVPTPTGTTPAETSKKNDGNRCNEALSTRVLWAVGGVIFGIGWSL